MKILVENEVKTKSYVSSQILECIDFWNREGSILKQKNISGEYGSKKTQAMAKEMELDNWLLEMMLCDCKTFVNSEGAKNEWECGRTRSHIWVHHNNERVLMIYTK